MAHVGKVFEALSLILQQPPRQYTPKERDMVLKNTELSFRVRQLEEKNSELERFKRELVRVMWISCGL